jgi:N,N-dimethylformamidase
MLKLLGYPDRLSVAPGETVAFRVHAEPDIAHYDAAIVRLYCGDRNPDGPGFRVAPWAGGAIGQIAAQRQATDAGSYIRVTHGDAFPRLKELTIGLFVWPTLADSLATLIAKWSGNAGFILALDHGRPVLRLGAVALRFDAELPLRRWTRLVASIAADRATLAIDTSGRAPIVLRQNLQLAPALDCTADLLIAGREHGAMVHDHFNGRIEAPCLLAAAREPQAMLAALDDPRRIAADPALIAAWDFAIGIDTTMIRDIGPHGLDGETVNLPTRAVAGRLWDGSERDWRRAPRHYAAIHFHDDDLYDARWRESFSWRAPDDLPSGVYAAHLSAAGADEYLPFFVRPRRPGGAAGVAFLAPTASYIAYGNDHCLLHGNNPEVLAHRLVVLNEGDVYLAEHPELGLSLYDTHRDGSGVAYASRLRPMLNLRPQFTAWQGCLGSGLWNFSADLHLVDWLDRTGIAHEVITDEDLEREGHALLSAYRVVITGTHPEYYSPAMRGAVERFIAEGGRLMYLGGNGFYWKIAFSAGLPGAIEVRRGEDGNRSWAAEPGEYRHSFDGEYGGLWRRNGKPPQALVGVGYTAQGFNVSIGYRRLPASFDPRASFVFAGVGDETIGDFGLNGGGAAGVEIDRADPLLGTPDATLVLATADRFPDSYIVTNEDVLVNRPTILGMLSPLVRADLTLMTNARGGAVFATGSIAWCGALPHNGSDNNVARVTANVLRRFLDPAPLGG